MNNLHLRYLREMGIDVWRLRSETRRSAAQVTHTPDIAMSESLPTDSPTSSAGTSSAGTSPAGTSPAGTSPAGTSPAGTSPAGTSSARLVRDESLQPAVLDRAPESAVKVEQPTFLFCFLDYENLSLMFSLELNIGALPADVRQFADDVNLAVNPGQRRIPRVRDLRWPMVNASHMQQSETDARQVVHQKMNQCCERLVVFGNQAAKYVTDSGGKPAPPRGRQVVIAEDIQRYFGEPQTKRDLWKLLSDLRHGI